MRCSFKGAFGNKHNRFLLCVLLVICASLIGCNKESAVKESEAKEQVNAPVTTATQRFADNKQFIPASVQRAGSAALGREAMITAPIVSCGLPMQAWRQIDNGRSMTLPSRKGDAASLPYNMNLIEDNNGVELAASNCLTCHAAPLFGELVIGLGNEFLDFTTDAALAVEQSGALVNGEQETAAWEKYADRVAAIAPYMQTKVAGVNPANNLTFALMAHRDPKTMAWTNKPKLALPPTEVPPVSVPPWWRMKKKHAMFWMGEGRGDHATVMMAAAIMCAGSLDEVAQLDAIAPDVRAFIESIEPPVYPFAIDAALAAKGQVVFDSTCSQCHGTYGEQPTYPNRIVDIDVVGTDTALIDFAFGDGQMYVDWFNQSPFGKLASAQPSHGYVAPPLDGIWATAPFLHNGSVPTIRALLDSNTRPVLWHHRVTTDVTVNDYDQENLGWMHGSITDLTQQDTLEIERQWLYDTRVNGYTNTGHQFGDGLTEEQRDAVIEYLKTL